MPQNIFKNIKVVEFASVLAGPSVGLFFAELGAKVIKIENPKTGGDVTRVWKSPNEKTGKNFSAYYASVNFKKKIVFLNLKNKTDLLKCYSIVKTSDIVIANFKPGDDKKLLLDYNSLKKINPKIIYGSISGFGDESKRSAFDLTIQAESGFMSINGEPKSPPLKMPVALIDLIAAHQMKEGLLIALLQKKLTGTGSHVKVSLLDSGIVSLANQATNFLIGKQIPQAIGSLHPNIAPYGEIFLTKDKKQITLAIGSDLQFNSLMNLLGLSKFISDKKYTTNEKRVLNRKKLFQIIQKVISENKFKSLEKIFLKQNIPFAEIKNIKQALTNPNVKHLIRQPFKNKKLKTITGNAFIIK